VRASINDTVKFTCSAGSASPQTIINFYFNNSLYFDPYNFGMLYRDAGIFVNSTFDRDTCSIQSTLTIQQFSDQFVGEYSCSISISSIELEGTNVTFSLAVEEGNMSTVLYKFHPFMVVFAVF